MSRDRWRWDVNINLFGNHGLGIQNINGFLDRMDGIEVLAAGMLAIEVAASDIQADEVDTKFLDKGHSGSARKSNGPTAVFEFDNRVLANKVFDRDNRDLNISILERNVKLGSILHPVSDNDLAAIGDVAARSVRVSHAVLGSNAGLNAMAGEMLRAIGNGNEGSGINHRPNTLGGSLDRLEGPRFAFNEISKFIEVLILNVPKCFRGFVPIGPTEHLLKFKHIVVSLHNKVMLLGLLVRFLGDTMGPSSSIRR